MANNAVIISQEHHTSFLHGMHVSYNPLGWAFGHQTINNEKPRKDILQFIFPADEREVEFKATDMLK